MPHPQPHPTKAAQGSVAAFCERRFTAEVRRFLDEALTPELQAAGRATVGTHSEIGASREWHRRLYQRGWIAPAWPLEHGGTGWNARQRLIFDRECAAADAPVLSAGGIRNVGPLLITEGTPAQKDYFLPRILNGETLWCQGYSEAGAGSDLARLQTRARRSGQHYIVNGTKLWTTGAQYANWMFALARSDSTARPQAGITFLLIPMDTPGIQVRPVTTLYGEAELNEVTFDDVQVSVANRVGEEHDGWRVAKQLMVHARASNTTCALLRRTLKRVREACAERLHADAKTVALGQLELRLSALERLEYAASHPDAEARAHHASLMKVQATELHQDMTTLLLEAAGYQALGQWQTEADLLPSAGPYASAKYLATRAATIYSGTSEVHRNLLARHLGAP